MIFHVINRETGEVVQARGFFAIGENGALYDVIDGWYCEGGGGSVLADSCYSVVLGLPPEERFGLFQSKGTGEWHVCRLSNRMWSPVSPMYKRKKDAVQWASDNHKHLTCGT